MMFHIASSQEALHASLLPLTELSGFRIKEAPPIQLHTYPLVPVSPPFPLLAQAPTSVKPGQTRPIDPNVLSATNLAYSRTLTLLKREVGPYFDLERIWEKHTYYVRPSFNRSIHLC